MDDKRWYAKGLRFECTQCGNCCRSHGAYAYVYLSEADIQAIALHLGLERAEFLTRHCELDRGWVTLRTTDPACTFLRPDNTCGIYPVRPKQCATWPFWTENLERATWEGPVSECCPGIGTGPVHAADEIDRLARETDAI
jgi:uncharacterized protein